MSLLLDAPPDLRGNQDPRVLSVPRSATDFREGDYAIELAEMAGLHLDPWQRLALRQMLARRDDGAWAAFEAALVVPRQNGKTVVLAAYELAALFLHHERLVIHSAHQYDTSMEAMRLILELIEGTPSLSKQVKARGVSRSHGAEGIELLGGRRIRFRTRTKGGGRGFSGGRLVFDEAMMFPTSTHSALMFVVSAQPEKQIVYAGSAVDREAHEDGWVLAGLRERALAGGDPALAYLEWSAGDDIEEAMTPEFASDPQNWASANPAIGVRPGITGEHIANEHRGMRVSNSRGFAVERLGVGDWPRSDEELNGDDPVIGNWADLIDPASSAQDPVCFAVDVSPMMSSACIAAAGHRPDGRTHVEVTSHDGRIDHRPGTHWVVPRLIELAKHKPVSIRYAERSPAAALVKQAAEAGVRLDPVKTSEHAEACSQFLAATDPEQDKIRHLGSEELAVAVAGAAIKWYGESWLWSRTKSDVDITPLVACTLARWGLFVAPERSRMATFH